MILDEIIKNKREELAAVKQALPLLQLEERVKKAPDTRGFSRALTRDARKKNRIIAEVKKASPSKGVIRQAFDPVAIAREYEQGGAAAVSVLTEERYFQGKLEYLQEIKKSISLPVLRKDFIFDPYQVYEARAFGADALLLIAAALDPALLRELLELTHRLSMEALVEVHTREELAKVLEADARIIGINNRNLRTFATDIMTTVELLAVIPDDQIVVSESGINTVEDIRKLKAAGADAFLIGESLMREPSPGRKLQELVG
jgi:indole-3-glycerol phosphate synthase